MIAKNKSVFEIVAELIGEKREMYRVLGRDEEFKPKSRSKRPKRLVAMKTGASETCLQLVMIPIVKLKIQL